MKFDFFNDSTQPLIGVDISTTAVKMVELSASGKGTYRLEGYSIAAIPKDAIVDGNISGLEQVSDAVKLAWKLLGSREKRTALALPSAAVITKKVMMQLPATPAHTTIQNICLSRSLGTLLVGWSSAPTNKYT